MVVVAVVAVVMTTVMKIIMMALLLRLSSLSSPLSFVEHMLCARIGQLLSPNPHDHLAK